MRLTASLLGLNIDVRLMSFTALGCSIFYLRLDVRTRTLFFIDLERVKRSHRSKPLEGVFRLGPFQFTNRTYYVG